MGRSFRFVVVGNEMGRKRGQVVRHGFDRVAIPIHPSYGHALAVVFRANGGRYSGAVAGRDNVLFRWLPLK
jgi:hypothetical protein